MSLSITPCRIKISGEAGDGIITTGDILMRAAARLGYYSTSVKTIPSNIRGGYSQSLVTISADEIVSPIDDCTILFSLSAEALLHDTKMPGRNIPVFVEADIAGNPDVADRLTDCADHGNRVVAVPVVQLARETAGNCLIRSTVVMGVLCRLLGLDRDVFATLLHDHFGSKGAEIDELNQIAFNSGYLWSQQHAGGLEPGIGCQITPHTDDAVDRVILDGNQAVALGALAAGCSFYASYPITPATSVGETLAGLLRKAGGFAYQAEDEIAALGAVIGASFGGAKGMTATSGPGLSLMQEFIGYASMVELPVVIVDVQRAGPSTGMPTKHSQDDLFAAVYGGHGEGPRIVIAPHSVADCYHATIDAFNAAEQYQCPVILLSDSSLSSTRSVVPADSLHPQLIVNRRARPENDVGLQGRFYRYAPIDEMMSGYLPMPGMGGVAYCATGIEHNDDSTPATAPDVRIAQMNRRMEKCATIEHAIKNSAFLDIPDDEAQCDVGICSWGFTVCATRAVVEMLRQRGVSVAAIYPRLLYPLCSDALSRWIAHCRRHVVVEANYHGQYRTLIQSKFAVSVSSLTVFRGEPFSPAEIAEGVIRLLQMKDGIQ